MTESAAIATEAEKACYKELDVDEYKIIATLDKRTSQICREMDGKHFPVSEMKAGVTAPPFHPWCRTDTAPYFDDWEEMGISPERAARDQADQVYYVPESMTYREWEKNALKSKLNEKYSKKLITNHSKNDIIKTKKIDQIIREMLKLKPTAKVHIPARQIQLTDIIIDNNHINVLRKHDISKEQILEWINAAKFSVTVWNGQFERYYSDSGAVYFDTQSHIARTAYSSEEYTDNIIELLKVLNEYGL